MEFADKWILPLYIALHNAFTPYGITACTQLSFFYQVGKL